MGCTYITIKPSSWWWNELDLIVIRRNHVYESRRAMFANKTEYFRNSNITGVSFNWMFGRSAAATPAWRRRWSPLCPIVRHVGRRLDNTQAVLCNRQLNQHIRGTQASKWCRATDKSWTVSSQLTWAQYTVNNMKNNSNPSCYLFPLSLSVHKNWGELRQIRQAI